MLKVMIIDDEYYFRQALKAAFPWDELGMEVCGEAEDGLEALELVTALKPDIALVDINMPIMDGLELVREIKTRDMPTKLIILTGYGEFGYAKQAVELGVNNYLLKPVNDEELKKSLLSVKSYIESEARVKLEIDLLNRQVIQNKPLLRQNLLCDILLGSSRLRDEEFRSRAAYLDIDISFDYYRVAAVEIDGIQTRNWSENDKELWKFAVYNIALEILSREYSCNACFDFGGRICCILAYAGYGPGSVDLDISALCDIIRSSIQKHLKFTVTIGIGSIYEGIDKISSSYSEAVFALKSKLTAGGNNIITYSSNEDADTIANYFPIEMRKNLLISMRTNNAPEIADTVRRIFSDLTAGKVHPEIIYVHCIELISTCIEFATECKLEYIRDLFQNGFGAFNEVFDNKSLPDIEQWILDIFIHTTDMVHRNRKNKAAKLIVDIKAYVDQHYDQSKLRIDDIARHLFLDYHYLCKVFKKETGKTLNDYITEIRVNKARELIDTGSYSLAAVADKVGYENPNYFGKCFKKHTGLSPARYMENKN